jgi:hypothetical protein
VAYSHPLWNISSVAYSTPSVELCGHLWEKCPGFTVSYGLFLSIQHSDTGEHSPTPSRDPSLSASHPSTSNGGDVGGVGGDVGGVLEEQTVLLVPQHEVSALS